MIGRRSVSSHSSSLSIKEVAWELKEKNKSIPPTLGWWLQKPSCETSLWWTTAYSVAHVRKDQELIRSQTWWSNSTWSQCSTEREREGRTRRRSPSVSGRKTLPTCRRLNVQCTYSRATISGTLRRLPLITRMGRVRELATVNNMITTSLPKRIRKLAFNGTQID